MSATPRPWRRSRIAEPGIWSGDPGDINGRLIATFVEPHAEENLALVLQAVNLLPELVVALERARSFAALCRVGGVHELERRNVLETIDASLQKARST